MFRDAATRLRLAASVARQLVARSGCSVASLKWSVGAAVANQHVTRGASSVASFRRCGSTVWLPVSSLRSRFPRGRLGLIECCQSARCEAEEVGSVPGHCPGCSVASWRIESFGGGVLQCSTAADYRLPQGAQVCRPCKLPPLPGRAPGEFPAALRSGWDYNFVPKCDARNGASAGPSRAGVLGASGLSAAPLVGCVVRLDRAVAI